MRPDETHRAFVNAVLGETWTETGDSPDWQRLHERREDYHIGAERSEEGVWQRDGERRAVAEPPRAVGAAGGLRRQVPADAAASQPRKAGTSTLPLLPGDGTQPSPDPLVEIAQH